MPNAELKIWVVQQAHCSDLKSKSAIKPMILGFVIRNS